MLDLQFPQMENPNLAPENWRPHFTDYLYTSFANGTSFAPADAMPLTFRMKVLFTTESVVSLVTIAIVAARAVNILALAQSTSRSSQRLARLTRACFGFDAVGPGGEAESRVDADPAKRLELPALDRRCCTKGRRVKAVSVSGDVIRSASAVAAT